MASNIKFSIIILSHNTDLDLSRCVESIYKHTESVSFEVLVVDHNSSDNSPKTIQKLTKQHSNIKSFLRSDNPGFGSGNNFGTRNSAGEYLLFLNSDTLFTYNVLKSILPKLNGTKKLGAYSVCLHNPDGSFQASGGVFPTLSNLILWQLGIDDLPILNKYIPSFHPKKESATYNVGPEWVTGAFLVVPSGVFHSVGGFDENIFMYTEEMELCYRISKLGKKIIYDENESIIHKGGASGGTYLSLTSEVKYIIYFWQKHKPGWQVIPVKLFIFIGSLLRLLFFGIIRQNETYKRSYLEAIRLCF